MWKNFWPTAVSLTVVSSFALALFHAFGGATILDVTNTSWFKGGDPYQHLLGWLFYRGTDLWQFPIGLNPNFGELMSGSIVYSDSIPLFAVVFRLLNAVLPENFQYFGLWILTCFLFQGIFGYWLLRLLGAARSNATLGGCLFVASPYMLWRLHGHEALIGHWIVLAAVCLYLVPKMRWVSWALLLAIATGVHAYLAAMAGAIWLVKMWTQRQDLLSTALRAIATITLLVVWAWLLGYFVFSSAAAGQNGFGIYRATLLGWLDNDGMWGRILPDLPESPGTYEGFAYLGFGALLVVLACGLGLLWFGWKKRPIDFLPPTEVSIKPLLLTCVAFTLFALSNKISFLGNVLIEINLPTDLPGFSTFRASGRFIWLPSYMLVALAIVWVSRVAPTRLITPALFAAVFLQVADMNSAIKFFDKRFSEPQELQFTSAFWNGVGAQYDRIAVWPIDPHRREVLEAAFVAARNGMSINQAYLARYDSDAISRTRDAMQVQLASGTWSSDTLYLVNNLPTAEFLGMQFAARPQDVMFAEVDGVWIVAPDWTGCTLDCGANPVAFETKDPPALPEDGVLTFGKGGNSIPYQIWGWSEAEDWGSWTEGPVTTLLLSLGELAEERIAVEVIATPFLTDSNGVRSVAFRANGRALLDISLSAGSQQPIVLGLEPEMLAENNTLLLEIYIKNPQSPLDAGISADARKLGLFVESISFNAEGT